MAIIRHKQRAVTSLSPAPNQGRWINPSKGELEIIAPFFTFGTTSSALATGLNLNTGAAWKLVWRMRVETPSATAAPIIDQAAGMRVRIRSDLSPDLRTSVNVLTFTAITFRVDEVYDVTYDVTAAGSVTATAHNRTVQEPDQVAGGSTTVISNGPIDCHMSNNTIGTEDFIGPIVALQWFESDVLVFDWPMRDGEGATEFANALPGPDFVLTEGDGFWTPPGAP